MKKKLIAVVLCAIFAISAITVNIGDATVYAMEDSESAEEMEEQSEVSDGVDITLSESEFIEAEELTEENASVDEDANEVLEETTVEEVDTEVVASEEAVTDEVSESIEEETAEEETVVEEADKEQPVEEKAEEELKETLEESEEEVTYNQVFNQDKYVDGIHILLYAAENVLPDDAKLEVSRVSDDMEKAIAEAADEKTGDEVEVETTYSFDINIYSESLGGYVQPKDGTVSVRFENVATDDNEAITVYHVEENNGDIEGLNQVATSGEGLDQVEFAAEHFSVYSCVITFDLTSKYNNLYGETNRNFNFTVSCFDENGNPIGVDNQTINCSIDATTVSKIEKGNHSYTAGSKYFDVMGAQPTIQGYELLRPSNDGIALNGYSGLYYNGYPVARGLNYTYEEVGEDNGIAKVINLKIYFYYVANGQQVRVEMYDNIAFTAKYSALITKVNYHSNFGEDKVIQKTQSGEKLYSDKVSISLSEYEDLGLPMPEEGYYFMGWSTEKNPQNINSEKRNVQKAILPINGTVDYYAVWQQLTINFHLNYKNMYGDSEDIVITKRVFPTVYDRYGYKCWEFTYPTLEELGASKIDGYKFTGWQTEKDVEYISHGSFFYADPGDKEYISMGSSKGAGVTKDFYAFYFLDWFGRSDPKEPAPEVKEPEKEEPAPEVKEPEKEEPAPEVKEPEKEEPAPVVKEPQKEEQAPVVETPQKEEQTPVVEETKTVETTPVTETSDVKESSSDSQSNDSSEAASSETTETTATAPALNEVTVSAYTAAPTAATKAPVVEENNTEVADNKEPLKKAIEKLEEESETLDETKAEPEEEPKEETVKENKKEDKTETTIENESTPKAKTQEESNNFMLLILLVCVALAAVAGIVIYHSKKKVK